MPSSVATVAATLEELLLGGIIFSAALVYTAMRDRQKATRTIFLISVLLSVYMSA
jgi:hypothetical protein